MSKLKVELNIKEVGELLKSDEIKAMIKEKGDGAMQILGSDYELTTYTGISRANVSIVANTYKSKKDNSKNNSILKAVMAQK